MMLCHYTYNKKSKTKRQKLATKQPLGSILLAFALPKVRYGFFVINLMKSQAMSTKRLKRLSKN